MFNGLRAVSNGYDIHRCKSRFYQVWLARLSHLIAGALRAGKGWSSGSNNYVVHTYSTNQMLLAGISANSIHSLGAQSHILCPSMAMDFFLTGDGATGEGRSGLERPLARFKLERKHDQEKPYLGKCTSWRRQSQSLSEHLTP